MEKKSIVNAIVAGELIPGVADNELNEPTAQTYLKLPLSRMAALDVGLEPFMVLFQQVTSHG